MTDDPRAPAAFRLDAAPEFPPRAPRKPRALAAAKILIEPDAPSQLPAAVPAATPLRGRWRWAMLFASSLAALVSLWAGLAVTRLIEDLFRRSAVFGWIGLGLAGLAALAAIAILFRESWGLIRLGRIEQLQLDAVRALATNDAAASQRAIARIKSLYGGRADAAWGLEELAEHERAVMDPADRIRLADRDIVKPFDAPAHRIVARTARRVMLLTTVTPMAALDILFVATLNLRMLRELAALYGGRPSTLATLRLARMAMGHLAVTGGLALSDSFVQHFVGKGLIGRLSARFGEGTVNGILTARIGLAAQAVCRPLPRDENTRERLGGLVRELLNFKEEDDAEDAA